MKITKVRIKNLFGITEFQSNGKSLELSGANGVGKSSFMDAVKYGLTNRSNRDYVIRKGATEGEILIETDTGLSIHRKKREEKADYRLVKSPTNPDIKESVLRDIFTELQLNPVEFINMTKEEQNRIILDMIDFKWDLNWIKEQFGEIVPDVNYEQNILSVLNDIQANEGFYFKKRESINREARNKKAFIDEIGQSLPPNYDAKRWERANLGEVYKEVETIRARNERIDQAKTTVQNRDNKVRGLEADLQIAISAIEKETDNMRTAGEKYIAELENKIKETRKELANLEEKKISRITLEKEKHKSAIAELDGEVKQCADLAKESPASFADLQKQAETIEAMKAHINEYNRMVELQSDVEKLNLESQELTAKIEKARSLPGEILERSSIPIENLTIKDGIPLINGLPISNLSDGEKLELCVKVAVQKPEALNILLIDGVERLSSINREKLYAELKQRGVQFISSRTTDESELSVVEL